MDIALSVSSDSLEIVLFYPNIVFEIVNVNVFECKSCSIYVIHLTKSRIFFVNSLP